MTGERKSSDLSGHIKRGAKLISKASKASSGTIITPPKAAIAAPSAKKDEIHRRRNPFNDMLRRGGGEPAERGRDTQHAASEHEPKDDAPLSLPSEQDVDVRMGDRVAELERALTLAKQEQHVLKEELEKARLQGQAERDTIEGLRQQLVETQQNAESAPSRASDEHGRDNQIRRSSDRSEDDLLRQTYELRYRLVQLQEQLVAQDAMYRDHTELRKNSMSHEEAEWNELRSRLHATEKESQERLQQLLSLKSSISSLTRVDSQVTDSELMEAFSQLANRIREWVITNFRRSTLNFDKVPADLSRVLRSIAPNYETVGASDRLALYQAVVSSTLMEVFQEPLVVGLPKTGPLAAIRSFAEKIPDTEWRRATVRALENSETRHALESEKESLLHRLAEDIQRLLFTLTSINLTPSAESALLGILSTAAGLQHTLALQKARYHVLFFRKQPAEDFNFDDRRMESVNDLDSAIDEDGDTLIERKIRFCVFPCVEKFGDEWGEHLETSNVLLKARVLCGVG